RGSAAFPVPLRRRALPAVSLRHIFGSSEFEEVQREAFLEPFGEYYERAVVIRQALLPLGATSLGETITEELVGKDMRWETLNALARFALRRGNADAFPAQDYAKRREAGFGDVPVMACGFRTNIADIVEINENDAFNRLYSRFMDPALSEVLSRYADTAPNGWTPFHVNAIPEATGVGHRVDYVWSRDMANGTDRSRAGILTPQNPNRARFLVHEHKSPAKFPYGLTEDDLDDLAESYAQRASDSLDEARGVVNSAWEMACDDLVDYWELGEGFHDRESSVRFRYPIIQIYVYMLRSFCKYGVLSTTDRTWFFKIDNDNVLHISDSFLSTATGRGSMRHAYACMLRRNLVGGARLTLDEEHLRAICQTDIRIGNPEWADVWRRAVARMLGFQ
ncbi:Hypothetical Protein FCC1311_098752, partial [Hondaea fermentalgiana]